MFVPLRIPVGNEYSTNEYSTNEYSTNEILQMEMKNSLQMEMGNSLQMTTSYVGLKTQTLTPKTP